MQVSRWFAFAGLIAYCGDIALYEGVHADAVAHLARNVAHGILLGLRQFA
jgi:hypothetical protein